MDTFIWYKNCQKWSDDIFPRWLPHGHWKTPVPRLSRSLSPWEVIFFLLFFNLVRCIFVFNPNERHFYENVSKCVFLKKWKKDMIYKTTWQCKHLKGQLDPLSVKWRFLIKRGQLDPFVGWFEGAKRNVENIPKLHSCPTIHSGFGLVFKIVTLHFLDDLAVAEIEIKFTFIPRCSICCEWQLKFGTKARDCNMNSYAVITGICLKYHSGVWGQFDH